VYALLDSRPQGLTAAEASERLGRDGANVLERVRGPGLVRRLSANFTHFMALLLWVGAVIALVGGLPQLGLAICLVNVVNGLFSFWQEYKAERATEALQRLLPTNTTVIRDGRQARVRAEDLVVGDVVLLNEGDRVSADARLVDHIELRVDQSTLTGESRPVRKSSGATFGPETEWVASPNLVFAGTTVGSASTVMAATGASSTALALNAPTASPPSPAATRSMPSSGGSPRRSSTCRG
jgi:magnesium-transporting ATPase (P-type)